jgi:hypothetical protein
MSNVLSPNSHLTMLLKVANMAYFKHWTIREGGVLSITPQWMHKLYIIHKSKIYYIKTLKMLLYVSILRSSSGSTYCSLLKLHVKIVNMSLYLSVMWQHIVCLYRIQEHMICWHITDRYNNIFTILICNFSKEQYMLPEDDLRIETCRSILSVVM